MLVRSSSPPQPAILLEGVGMFSVSVVVSTSRGAVLPPPSSSSHVSDSEQLSTIITSSAVVLDTAELVDATVVVVDVVEVVHGFCSPMILKPK